MALSGDQTPSGLLYLLSHNHTHIKAAKLSFSSMTFYKLNRKKPKIETTLPASKYKIIIATVPFQIITFTKDEDGLWWSSGGALGSRDQTLKHSATSKLTIQFVKEKYSNGGIASVCVCEYSIWWVIMLLTLGRLHPTIVLRYRSTHCSAMKYDHGHWLSALVCVHVSVWRLLPFLILSKKKKKACHR